MFLRIFLVLMLPLSATSQVIHSLPSEINKQMELRVNQGTCQNEWVKDLQSVKTYSTNDESQKIYAVPCSLWAHNQAWSIFLVISQAGGFELVKPLYFIRYSSYKGLYADSVVENISWDDDKKILKSQKFLNGKSHCGELAGYQWNEANQDFKVISVYKNDDCNVQPPEWDKAL